MNPPQPFYDLRDQKQAIREAQQQLRTLYKAGMPIVLVTPDGIFGKNTVDSVRDYQRNIGLPITGIIDLDTWFHLFNQARLAREQQ